jgi:cysteine desulfurase
MQEEPIYLDYNATTPCDPAVIEYMLPWFGKNFGNASSRQHTYGWKASEVVKLSRESIAAFIGCDPEEIFFTSGATESVNMIIKGIAETYHNKGRHIITAATEHAAVRDTCKSLSAKGFEISFLEPDGSGIIDPKKLQEAIRPDTILIALMWANNETGVIQPIEEYITIANEHDIIFFSDATQALGKVPVNLAKRGIGALAFSAHKIYGPKGVGAVYISRKNPRVRIAPLIEGGGQEKNLRSGTLNVPGIAGLGEAVRLAKKLMTEEAERITQLRNKFEKAILQNEEVYVNGDTQNRLPGVSNLCFRFTDGAALLSAFNKNLAVSAGSACSSASGEPSPVLLAMGLGRSAAYASIRFSLGRFTTPGEIENAIAIVNDSLKMVRESAYPSFQSLCTNGSLQMEWAHPGAAATSVI